MASAEGERCFATDVPEVIFDTHGKKEYVRGRFLGKGGFGKCYEFINKNTNEVFAGKVVSKALLVKPSHKAKMTQEIEIQKALDHKHIVRLHSYFEDNNNVYIILELCCRRTLMEMNRRRSKLTEGEARYFIRQLLLACRYMREQQVVHRDLKLRNLLLNEKMELKVADFGLSTRINYEGERKKTLCGSPNYIAPEILSKKGHSFEVDVWSVGCILYTLIVGHPPFVASTLEETYARIKQNRYSLPPTMSSEARDLIRSILQQDPKKRPTIDDILKDGFITSGPLPSHLPTSCLVVPPRFDALGTTGNTDGRRALLEKNEERELEATVTPLKESQENGGKPEQSLKSQLPASSQEARAPPASAEALSPGQREGHLKVLQRLLQQLLTARPPECGFDRPDEAEDPASAPILWIGKWVAFTDKYGMGYQLCDGSTGVLFIDDTRIVLLNNNVSIAYVDEDGAEHYYTLEEHPASLEKKVKLLKHFSNFMEVKLQKTGRDVSPREGDNLVRLPVLGSWLRTRTAMCFYLTNGIVQVNFLRDHSKLILCPRMAAVTHVKPTGTFHTYRLKALQRGCPPELLLRLQYARTIIDKMAAESF
ncbi:serine/threonine-protein kinase PLK1-like [Amblyomma americanum]